MQFSYLSVNKNILFLSINSFSMFFKKNLVVFDSCSKIYVVSKYIWVVFALLRNLLLLQEKLCVFVCQFRREVVWWVCFTHNLMEGINKMKIYSLFAFVVSSFQSKRFHSCNLTRFKLNFRNTYKRILSTRYFLLAYLPISILQIVILHYL